MQDFIEELKAMTTEYGIEATSLCVNLAIEIFSNIRNYPPEYTDEQILADMQDNKAKIAMAIVELDDREGMEGQTSHSENGYSRAFSENIVAYKNVVCIV